MGSTPLILGEETWREFWASLASVLRSYLAAHGLNSQKKWAFQMDGDQMLVDCGDKWLHLERRGSQVIWRREDETRGTVEFTAFGQLRGEAGEEEMDMAAEAWARELMA